MRKKNQHIIPQVYLKQFGFTKYRNKWFVSVKNKTNEKWEDREIKRFLVGKDYYTLDVCYSISNLIIENDLNGKIESRLPKIIDYLDFVEIGGNVHHSIHMDIAETTANFLCRNEITLEWIRNWTQKPNIKNFFDFIAQTIPGRDNEDEGLFEHTMGLPQKDKILNLMVYLMMKIKRDLVHAKMTIFRNEEDMYLFTSNNPVSLMNVGIGETAKDEMEIFFPISKDYLVYFYWNKTMLKAENMEDKLIDNSVQLLNEELYNYFSKDILPVFADKFIILPTNKENVGR